MAKKAKPHWTQTKAGKKRLSEMAKLSHAKRGHRVKLDKDKVNEPLPEMSGPQQAPAQDCTTPPDDSVIINFTEAHFAEAKLARERQYAITYATGYCQGWLAAYAINKPISEEELTRSVAQGLLENTVR